MVDVSTSMLSQLDWPLCGTEDVSSDGVILVGFGDCLSFGTGKFVVGIVGGLVNYCVCLWRLIFLNSLCAQSIVTLSFFLVM